MALDVLSQFFLPFVVTISNQNLNFDEGGSELTAVLAVGSYSFSELPTIIKTAFDAVGSDIYTITQNRSTRKITIASDGATLNLLSNTGSQVGTSTWSLLGFDTSADQTGATSYEGDNPAGIQYRPQFWLQDFVGPDEQISKADASVNEPSDGSTVETISYGDKEILEMSIKFITSNTKASACGVIENNPTGKEDAIVFLKAIITKNKFEFMVDRDTPNTFEKVILESLPGNTKGTGYKLAEEVGRNLPDIYSVNKMKLRVVT